MKLLNKKKPKKAYRLYVRVRDKQYGEYNYDSLGREIIYTKWIEVPEINLGSLNNPNKEILEWRFVPVSMEQNYSD